MFDTLAYARKLQQAGFTSQQAEAQAEALREVLELEIATKPDIAGLRRDLTQQGQELRREMAQLGQDLRGEMQDMEGRLQSQMELMRRDMEVMRRDIIIWLGGLIVVATTALGALMKLL